MTPSALFLVEVGICLVSSTIAGALLARPLRRILVDACGTLERARFWVAYCGAMIYLVPLVTVVVFGKSGDRAAPALSCLKAALGSALFGVLVALAAIGMQVARLLPRRADDRGQR